MSRVLQQLTAFLHEQLPGADDLEVTGLSLSGGGSSKENWAFDAAWTGPDGAVHERLMLRRDPPSGVVDTGQAQEYAVLRGLAGSGLPVPRCLFLDADGSWFDRPAMVVERASGRASRGALKPADPLGLGPEGRLRLAQDMVDTLVRVHAVDVEAAGLADVLPAVGSAPAQDELHRWAAELAAQQLEPQPALQVVLRWLWDHVPPPPERLVLVHGDFRPANVLVTDGRLQLLLDWELAHLGDPLDDLGWYTNSLYTGEHFFPEWQPAQLLERYAAASGRSVDLQELAFWRVLSCFRLAVIALTGVRMFVDGRAERPAPPADGLVRRALAECREAL